MIARKNNGDIIYNFCTKETALYRPGSEKGHNLCLHCSIVLFYRCYTIFSMSSLFHLRLPYSQSKASVFIIFLTRNVIIRQSLTQKYSIHLLRVIANKTLSFQTRALIGLQGRPDRKGFLKLQKFNPIICQQRYSCFDGLLHLRAKTYSQLFSLLQLGKPL